MIFKALPQPASLVFLALRLALLDLTSKYIMFQALASASTPSIPLWPGVLHLTLAQNKGVAFSFFSDWPVAFLVFLNTVLLGLLLYALWQYRAYLSASKRYYWAAALLLAGAIGNGADRLLNGGVTDFIDLRWLQFPIFNLADVFLTLSVALFIWGKLTVNDIKSERMN
ncbi:MAG: signal peptidase II [Vampirovibrionales bacterium]|nr:signal peptidase II [Vampirovibrionales bacterium]